MKILFPVRDGVLVQPYGANIAFYEKNFGIPGHNGVDIVSFHGDALLCCEDGFVYKIYGSETGSVTKGFGVCIIGNPDPIGGGSPGIYGICNVWVYWHTMSNLQAKVGDIVKQGKCLAYEGDSGAVYSNLIAVPDAEKGKPPYPGTHLHWGLLKALRTSLPTGQVLSDNAGNPFKDSEGYFYEVQNYDNGLDDYIDPMKEDVIYYKDWLEGNLDAAVIPLVPVLSPNPQPQQISSWFDSVKAWLQNIWNIISLF